jgi:hypothetical protein
MRSKRWIGLVVALLVAGRWPAASGTADSPPSTGNPAKDADAQVVQDRRAIADFEAEARRAGVPPGWLR